jgi:hypothetical protein
MGYLYNHLATVVCAVFAGVLTLLWPLFVDFAAVYDLVFIMAVPIMWFLTAVCFVAQRSTDYVHGHQPGHKSAKKLTYTSDGQVSN